MRLNASYQIELDNLVTLPLCYRNEAGEWEDNDFTEQNLSDSDIAQARALATSEAKTAFKQMHGAMVEVSEYVEEERTPENPGL